MTHLWLIAAAGALAGAASLPHCAVMCGPLAGVACAPSAASSTSSRMRSVQYALARLLAYALAGAVVGAFGSQLAIRLPAKMASAVVSWLFAAGLLVAAVRMLRARRGAPAERPVALRRKPSLSRRILERAIRHPLTLGFATALLPCGALYSALLLAAATTSPWLGAASMAAFACTSSPALLGAAWLGSKVRDHAQSTLIRWAPMALVLLAMWSAVRPIPSLLSPAPACPACVAGR